MRTTLVTAFPGFTQILKHGRCPVDATAGCTGRANKRQQPQVFDSAVQQGLVQPLIETAARYPEHSAHCCQPVRMAMIINKSVLYSGSLAKYGAAFFKMLRCSSVRRNCALKLRISLLASISSAACSSVLPGLTAFTHLYRL
jgi:hypothetical protein